MSRIGRSTTCCIAVANLLSFSSRTETVKNIDNLLPWQKTYWPLIFPCSWTLMEHVHAEMGTFGFFLFRSFIICEQTVSFFFKHSKTIYFVLKNIVHFPSISFSQWTIIHWTIQVVCPSFVLINDIIVQEKFNLFPKILYIFNNDAHLYVHAISQAATSERLG